MTATKARDLVSELFEVLDDAERVVASRVGAGRPLFEAFHVNRWARRMTHVGVTTPDELAQRVLEALHECVDGFTDDRSRVSGVHDGFALARQRLPIWLSEGAQGAHIVYRLYGATGVLLYVGISDRGPKRLVEHYRDKPWFPLVTRVEFERYESRRLAGSREVKLIRLNRPLFNVQHNR